MQRLYAEVSELEAEVKMTAFLEKARDFLARSLTLILGLAAVYAGKQNIVDALTRTGNTKFSTYWLEYSDVVLLGIAAFWISIWAIPVLAAIAAYLTSPARPKWIVLEPFYEVEEESQALLEFSNAILAQNAGTAALGLEKLRMVMQKNPTFVVRIGKKIGAGKLKKEWLTGYFVLAPLTEQAAQDVLKGRVATGHLIGPQQLADDYRTAKALYIFGVYARKGTDAERALCTLIMQLKQLIDAHPGIADIFARGGTEDGKHHMKKFAFEPIRDSSIERLKAGKFLTFWPSKKKEVERKAIPID